jgi:hypothetical protein
MVEAPASPYISMAYALVWQNATVEKRGSAGFAKNGAKCDISVLTRREVLMQKSVRGLSFLWNHVEEDEFSRLTYLTGIRWCGSRCVMEMVSVRELYTRELRVTWRREMNHQSKEVN